jgi:hypothetical protein
LSEDAGPAHSPKIDWSRIDLPSGRITFKQICDDMNLQDKPQCGAFLKFGAFDVRDILYDERMVVERAFANALGHGTGNYARRSAYLESLNDAYVHYGLSTGMEVTKQLVQNIESQATVLANGLFGRGR